MAGNYKLPIQDTMSTAWDKIAGSKGTFWAALGILILASVVAGLIGGVFEAINHVLGTVAQVIIQIYITALAYGTYYIGIVRAKDMPINYKMVFRGIEDPRRTVKLLVTVLITWLIMLPPVVILILTSMGWAAANIDSSLLKIAIALIYIVCGLATFYLVLRTIFGVYFVLDLDVNPIDAVKLSFKATKGNVLSILGIVLLITIVVIISALPLGIGLIWTIPFAHIVLGLAYKRLTENMQ